MTNEMFREGLGKTARQHDTTRNAGITKAHGPLLAACTLAMACLAACTAQPFIVEQPNLSGRQEPAVITVSDPQVYARETLVNDRLRESRLLKKLLDESEQIGDEDDFRDQFTAHINRDLATLTALKIGANATYDPLKAAQLGRQESSAQLDDEIQRYKQLTELAEARKSYQEARWGSPSDPANGRNEPPNANGNGTDTNGAGEDGDNGNPQPGQDPIVVDDTNNQLGSGSGEPTPDQGNGQSALSFDLEKLNELHGTTINTSNIKPDPLDQFRDLQAYRTELRQAMSEIGLDDLHDYDGNALYRMQFKLTSAPGRYKDKFGVARLTFSPPTLTDDEIRDLYYTWLSHVTFRMNQPTLGGGGYKSDDSYARLGTSLYRIIEIPYVSLRESYYNNEALSLDPCFMLTYKLSKPGEYKYCRFLKIAVPDNQYEKLSGLLKFGQCRLTEGDAKSYMEKQSIHDQESQLEIEKFELRIKRLTADRNSKNLLLQRAQVQNQELPSTESPDISSEKIQKAQMKLEIESINIKIQEERLKLNEFIQGLDEIRSQRLYTAESLTNLEKECADLEIPDMQGDKCESAYPQFSAAVRQLIGGSANRGGQLSRIAETTLTRWLRETDKKFQCSSVEFPGPPESFSKLVKPRPAPATLRGVKKGQCYCDSCVKNSNCSMSNALYAYNVMPLNRHLRTSDVMKTANSLEAGLNLAAALSSNPVSGDLGIDYLRQTMGNVEALERTPIVVGFADRISPIEIDREKGSLFSDREEKKLYDENTQQLPQVGWILGPTIRINARSQKLEMVQKPIAQRVAADISMPGWWPRVEVDLETGWVGSWKSTSQMLTVDNKKEGIHKEEFDVPMPLNSADLDALTNYLSRRTVGNILQYLNIRLFEPNNISACAKEVEILVEGANVWRSAEVFLGGIPAEEVRILPNMDGIAARFDLDKLFTTENYANVGLGLQQNVTLSLWTRNGSDSRELRLVGSRNKKGCVSRSSVATRIQTGAAEIVLAAPTVIDACSKDVTFLAKVYRPSPNFKTIGNNWEPILPVFLLGSTPAAAADVLDIEKDYYPKNAGWGQTFQVTFRGGPFAKAPDSPNIALSVVEGGNISSIPVMLRKCEKPPTPLEASISGSLVVSTGKSGDKKPVKIDVSVKVSKGSPSKNTKLAVRVAGGDSKKWYESKAVISSDLNDKNISVVGFEFKPDTAFSDGDKLEFAIVESGKSARGNKITELKGNLIYYQSKAKASIKAELEEDQGIRLKLQFPKNWENAYPKAKNALFQIKPDYKLTPNPLSPASAPKNLLEVTLTPPEDDNSLAEARKKADVKLTVTLKPNKPTDLVPDVLTADGKGLVLKKTN